MNLHKTFAETLYRTKIIAILRGAKPAEILDLCKLFEEEGLRLIEITLNSPEALRSIKLAASYAGDGPLLIGAGTVRGVAEVEDVAAAGGKYIISPHLSPAIIKASKEKGLVSIPGVFTPSEACMAEDCGADYLKLFPVSQLGASYCRDLKAVLKKPMIAVGGVALNNLKELLHECDGLGLGSTLYKCGKSLQQIRLDLQAIQAEIKKMDA